MNKVHLSAPTLPGPGPIAGNRKLIGIRFHAIEEESPGGKSYASPVPTFQRELSFSFPAYISGSRREFSHCATPGAESLMVFA